MLKWILCGCLLCAAYVGCGQGTSYRKDLNTRPDETTTQRPPKTPVDDKGGSPTKSETKVSPSSTHNDTITPKDNTLLGVVLCVLVVLSTIPAIFSCVLVFKLKSGMRCDLILERISALNASVGTSVSENLKTLPDGMKQVIAEEMRKLLEGVAKKILGLDRYFGELKNASAQDIGTLRGRIDSIASGITPVASTVKDLNAGLSQGVEDIKKSTAALASSLKDGLADCERRMAECARKEASIKLREETVEARVTAAVAEAQKDLTKKCQQLAETLGRVSEEAVQKRLEEQRKAIVAQKDLERETMVKSLQAECESRIVASVSAAERRVKNECATAESRLNETIAAKNHDITVAQQRLTERDGQLAAEQTAHTQTKSELMLVSDKLAHAEQTRQKAEKELVALQSKYAALSTQLYPDEILKNPEFAPLQNQLDGWSAKGFVGAGIARAAIWLFAARRSVAEVTWTLALRDISIGISKALVEEGKDAAAIEESLIRWAQFLNKHSDPSQDDACYFQLSVPKVGGIVDSSWMKQISGVKVGAVNSWAVYTAMGVRYQADIA